LFNFNLYLIHTTIWYKNPDFHPLPRLYLGNSKTCSSLIEVPQGLICYSRVLVFLCDAVGIPSPLFLLSLVPFFWPVFASLAVRRIASPQNPGEFDVPLLSLACAWLSFWTLPVAFSPHLSLKKGLRASVPLSSTSVLRPAPPPLIELQISELTVPRPPANTVSSRRRIEPPLLFTPAQTRACILLSFTRRLTFRFPLCYTPPHLRY